jgi:hypothetical protein
LTALSRAVDACGVNSENMADLREIYSASSASMYFPSRPSTNAQLPVTPDLAKGRLPHRRSHSENMLEKTHRRSNSENILEMREFSSASSAIAHFPSRPSSNELSDLAKGRLPHRHFDVVMSPPSRSSGKTLHALGERDPGPVQFLVKGIADAIG